MVSPSSFMRTPALDAKFLLAVSTVISVRDEHLENECE